MSKAIDVYLERRKTRQYVGRLSRRGKSFIFEYDRAYLYSENPVSIGPDLPLGKTQPVSSTLFPSFADRIPSRQNPAYEEYCQAVGISPLEKNPFVLLGTLGKKSPVTPFVCEPVREQTGFSAEDLQLFRKKLGLSIREFAMLFDVSQASIYRTENSKTSGRDILKKLAVYSQYPQMTLNKVKNSSTLNESKKNRAEHFLRSNIQSLYPAVGPFTVTSEDVQKCRPRQAVELLRRLILSECVHFNIPQNSSDISSNITAPDGGQDALIKWNQGVEQTRFLPERYNVFQVKARKILPNECKKEIFEREKNNTDTSEHRTVNHKKNQEHCLKPAVQNVLKNKGAYILFSTHSVSGVHVQVREEAVYDGIQEAGYDPNSVEVRFYDANIIANWLNSFPTLAVWFLKEVCGRLTGSWISWQEWKKDINHRSEFMYHDQLEKKRSDLYEHLSQPRRTAHLTGPSGTGKTRLAMEVFRPPTDNVETKKQDRTFEEKSHKRDISALALYSPLHLINETNIRDLKQSRAVLVIDNCPLDKAEQFHKIALQEDSNLSLLTIGQEEPGSTFANMFSAVYDSHVSSSMNNPHISDLGLSLKESPYSQKFQNPENFNQAYRQQKQGLLIRLRPDKEIVAKMLKKILKDKLREKQNISNIYIESLFKITGNFPLMAQLLRTVHPLNLVKEELPTIRKKMLWGLDDPDPQVEKVIKACALFDTVCMEDKSNQGLVIFDTSVERTKEELKYVAEHIAKMDYDEFYKKIKFFEKKQIIQQYGRFIQVRPKPLALWLAVELLKETPPESCIKWLLDMDKISKALAQKKADFNEQKYRQLSEEEKKEYKKQQEADQKRYKNMSNQKKQELEQWINERAPHQALRKSFCKQISYLKAFPKNPVTGIAEQEHQLSQDTDPEIQKIIRKLCKPEDLFGHEKVLSTGWGAECLYYLTDLAPEEVLSSLKKVIEKKTVEELLNMKEFFGMPSARRQWVHILQKLAFKKEFYLDSSHLLLKLAEAENEDYSNNATGIWTSHFQLVLSGTEADPETKFYLIKQIQEKGTNKQKEIALKALEKALPQQSGYTGNYNSSAIDPRIEWRPATYGEMWNYFRQALNHLVAFATSPNSLNQTGTGQVGSSKQILPVPRISPKNEAQNIPQKAQDIIAHSLPSLLKIKDLHEYVEKAVKQVMDFLPEGFWPLAIKSAERFLEYRSNKKTTETIKKTKEILKLLKSAKQDINHRFRLYVTESDDYQLYNPKKRNKGYSRTFTELIDDFTNHIQKTKLDKITGILKILFHGKQNNTIVFARETAKLFCKDKNQITAHSEHKVIKWTYKLLTYAKEWSKNPDFNLSFLCGWTAELNLLLPEETQKILDKIAEDPEYQEFLLPTYHSMDLKDKDIKRLINFLKQQKIQTNQLWELSHLTTAQKCQKVSPEKMTELILFLINKNAEWVRSALQIYSYYVYNDMKKKKTLLPALQKLLTKKSLLVEKSSKGWDNTMISHYYKRLVKDLFSLTEEKAKSHKTKLKKERVLDKPSANDKALEQEALDSSQIFAQFFVSTILQLDHSLYDFCIDEHSIKEIFCQIINKYPDMVLSEIAKTDQQKLSQPDIQNLFKSDNLLQNDNLLNAFNEETLKKWCAKAPNKIPAFLAQHVQLIEDNPDKNQTVWTDFAYFLFNTYGDREEVISSISVNLASPGVLIREGFLNYLESVQQAMMILKNHKHKNIRDFCKNQVSYLQDRINRMKQQDRERKEFGQNM